MYFADSCLFAAQAIFCEVRLTWLSNEKFRAYGKFSPSASYLVDRKVLIAVIPDPRP